MSKYDKRVEMTREEEGSYHRREVEHTVPPAPASTSKNYSTYSKQVVPVSRSRHTSDDDDDNYEEWTTSKRKVNHKTRQVETRVSRQLLVEDGKVIADSGPQVTTRIKEDNKVEECEKEKAPKNKGKFEAIENAPECGESHGRVLGEKKEISKVSREVREENMQYHDERFKELSGHDVHRRAIQAPHELITINDQKNSAESKPRGKMVHYSNKGKKYCDIDEILEVAKLAIDGSITKEVKRKKHHEECSEDEKPDERGEAEALRQAPIVQRSSRQHADIVHDFNDTSTPIGSSDDEADQHGRNRHGGRRQLHHQSARHQDSRSKDSEAFPRYEIDPLLNSLKDEDFRPASHSAQRHHSGDRYREHATVRKDSSDDEGDAYERRRPVGRNQHTLPRQRSPSPYQAAPVEIPEEYRANKHKLLTKKPGAHQHHHENERSFSPTSKSHLSHASHRSAKSHRSHKEDASVQAHLTDEEEERKSLRSSASSGQHSHEKTTRHLQRQSTANSSRNYYFGERKHRPASIRSSTSSSSLSDAKERARKSGARSKDSGFKSPHSMRSPTPISATGGQQQQQQIYSVSSKSRKNRPTDFERSGAVSPTPTSGSVGQRSVKTTTTTLAAGLTDRPRSRQSEAARAFDTASPDEELRRPPRRATSARETKPKRDERASKATSATRTTSGAQYDERAAPNGYRSQPVRVISYETGSDGERGSFDSVSLSSLGPNATTIKVPYKQVIEHEAKSASVNQARNDEPNIRRGKRTNRQNENELQENIENLRKRLDDINGDENNKQTFAKRQPENLKAEHFDYRTIVANVLPVSYAPKQQVLETYNVRVIEHNSPFHEQRLPIKSVNELSNSIARLESLNSEIGTRIVLGGQRGLSSQGPNETNNYDHLDNNNEVNFNIADYIKYDTTVAGGNNPGQQTTKIESMDNDDDVVSLVSSCSLQSTRTYDVRVLNHETPSSNNNNNVQQLSDEEYFPVELVDLDEQDDGTSKRPVAWILNPNDGSTTAIIAPPQPKKPEPPKIESKTEELAESRGGRSYYLELIEADRQAAKQQRPSSIDSLYSRWHSHSTLSNNQNEQSPHLTTTPVSKTPTCVSSSNINSRRSRQRLPASVLDLSNRRRPASSAGNNADQPALPFSGPPLGNRSRSSSCLASSTRPTKYSIYGGLKRPNDNNKPVPRLSYSRAIGPKSQRQLNAQPKTPSRYLKMK